MKRRTARRCDLRTARLRAGFTQVELARLAGVAQGVISRLETGQAVNPHFLTVLGLARALRMAPEDLRFTASLDPAA